LGLTQPLGDFQRKIDGLALLSFPALGLDREARNVCGSLFDIDGS
jgi:hypothetical protein